MVEYIRSIKIRIEVDSNKRGEILERTVDTFEELHEACEEMKEEMKERFG